MVQLLTEKVHRELQGILERSPEWNCPLAPYTSYNIGGVVDGLLRPGSTKELQSVLSLLERENIPWYVVGRGTNLLVSDEGFRGVVIVLDGAFRQVEFPVTGDVVAAGTGTLGANVVAGGGVGLTGLAKQCCERGFEGLEFGCGIPASVGGAVVMNAGAWGDEIGNWISGVEVTGAGGVRTLTAEALRFGYRCFYGFSDLKDRMVVTRVFFHLDRGEPALLKKRCGSLLRRRKSRQPISLPNCGSFFKNPPGKSAGKLIEEAGLKGMRVGGAMVAHEHGNFLVNTGGATAADVRALMVLVQERVQEKFSIELVPEVQFL